MMGTQIFRVDDVEEDGDDMHTLNKLISERNQEGKEILERPKRANIRKRILHSKLKTPKETQ